MCLKIGMDPFDYAPNRLPLPERTRNQIFLVKNQILASDQLPDLSFPGEIKRNGPSKYVCRLQMLFMCFLGCNKRCQHTNACANPIWVFPVDLP